MEDRRAAVRAAMLGGRTLTPAFLKELCVTLGGGDRGEVEEDFTHWSVTALAVGEGRVPTDIPALKRAVERLKPAHLVGDGAAHGGPDGPPLGGGHRRRDDGGLGVEGNRRSAAGADEASLFRGWPPVFGGKAHGNRLGRRWKAKRRGGGCTRKSEIMTSYKKPPRPKD